LSNSASQLQESAGLYEKHPGSSLEFEMAGYTIGRKTLYEDLFQLQAGECLVFDKKRQDLKLNRYYRFQKDERVEKTEDDLLDDLHEVVRTTFSKLIQSLNDSPVYLPLSGGLDSRFILAMLKEFKYDNIFTYTYGIQGLWEIKRAKRIAEFLKVKWHYIEFVPKETRKLFYTPDREKYYAFASGLNSIPHLAEYYALLRLRDENLIPDDAVVINGQTGDFLTGGHIPAIINTENTDVNNLAKAIIEKHFSLWSNVKTEENVKTISECILESLDFPFDSKLSKQEFATQFEMFEWQERQAKYVVNGQRAYEWLGYDWRLPLWSDELMAFWQNVNWQNKIGQKLYKNFLRKRNFAGIFDIILPKEYSYMPFLIKVFRKSIGGIGRMLSRDLSVISNQYSRYYMTYAPYYLHTSYLDYLTDAQWHRNPVSYWVRYYLNEAADDAR